MGRQLALNAETAVRADITDLLDALEQPASEGGVVLHATGLLLRAELPFPSETEPRPLSSFYRAGAYREARRQRQLGARPLRASRCSREMVVPVVVDILLLLSVVYVKSFW